MEYLINNSEFDVNEKEILHTLYEQMSVDYFEGNDTSLTNILDISIKALRNQYRWTEDELERLDISLSLFSKARDHIRFRPMGGSGGCVGR